jgi:DNA-binding NtrC family response regulator
MITWAYDKGITWVRLDSSPEALGFDFISQDPRVLEVLDLVHKVADTAATVLITGESGTGKEFIARALHEESSRRRAPFLAVNCAAITQLLQDSEFFGHVRGAFTGANENKVGKFEAAEGGTLFLDEIADMDRSLQASLLRILQYGEYAPVGATTNRYCDVRVVAATNRDLQLLIQSGAFRHDLFYRLNIIRLNLPPLRQRRADIPLLIDHFVGKYGTRHDKPGLKMSAQLRDWLLSYDFPGNVRELENIIQRGVILARHGMLTGPSPDTEIKPQVSPAAYSVNFHEAKSRAMEEFEQNYLRSILIACGGIVCRAAEFSGLSERNLHKKLKKYGIHGQSFRGLHRQPDAQPPPKD